MKIKGADLHCYHQDIQIDTLEQINAGFADMWIREIARVVILFGQTGIVRNA